VSYIRIAFIILSQRRDQ